MATYEPPVPLRLHTFSASRWRWPLRGMPLPRVPASHVWCDMNEWALLKNGRIVNVVTTTMCRRHMQERYPDYEIAWLHSLPADIQQQYQYWNERP